MSSGSMANASVAADHEKGAGPAMLAVGADQQVDPSESSPQFPHSPYSDGPQHVSTLILPPRASLGHHEPPKSSHRENFERPISRLRENRERPILRPRRNSEPSIQRFREVFELPISHPREHLERPIPRSRENFEHEVPRFRADVELPLSRPRENFELPSRRPRENFEYDLPQFREDLELPTSRLRENFDQPALRPRENFEQYLPRFREDLELPTSRLRENFDQAALRPRENFEYDLPRFREDLDLPTARLRENFYQPAPRPRENFEPDIQRFRADFEPPISRFHKNFGQPTAQPRRDFDPWSPRFREDPEPPLPRTRDPRDPFSSRPAIPLRRTVASLPRAYDHEPLSSEERRRPAAAYEILRKWHLKFSGRPDEDADAFLDRLTELRRFSDMEDSDLLRCLPVCLSGVAARWYETCEDVSSWGKFVHAWRENFGDPDYQEFLERDIRVRRQGSNEPVRDYLANIKAMMKRLRPPWPEEKRVKRIYWGARDELRSAVSLRSHSTLAELEADLREAERNFAYGRPEMYRSTNLVNREFAYDPRLYEPPPKNFGREKKYRYAQYETVNAVHVADNREIYDEPYRADPSRPREPRTTSPSAVSKSRLAPRPDHHNRAEPGRKRASPSRAEPSANRCTAPADDEPRRAALPSARQPRADDTCWNCRKPGHRSRNCREEPRVHCYRCGAPDVITKHCRRCNPVSGKSKRNRAWGPDRFSGK